MTVVNESKSNNINEEVGNLNTLMMKKITTEEKDMSFRVKCKELYDEDSFCFVLGYN